MIPFIPVSKPALWGNEKRYINDCVDSSWVSSAGKYITQFEDLNAQFCNTGHAVAVTNGTAALHVALVALGIGPGDEVIVPGLTFVASVNAVLYSGATPLLADVESSSWTIQIDGCEELLNERTKAIMAVHLYGQPCDMDKVNAFARKHCLLVIEDWAEAHGAEYSEKRVGSFGLISCSSFYGNKIVTCGEGGICLTNDPELFNKLRVLRDHGMNKDKRFWHGVVGFNYRMTNLQAAIGCAQMEKIDQILAKRAAISETYDTKLGRDRLITLQEKIPGRKKVSWLYPILIDTEHVGKDIRQVQIELAEKNIDSRPFFYSLNQMPPYQQLRSQSLVNAKTISNRGLCLPSFPDLSKEQIEYICDSLLKILDGN